MKRSAPMKRTGFKPKGWTPKPAKQIDYQPTPRAVAVAINDGKARMVVPIPKPEPTKPGKRTPTAAERAWMDAITAIGCIACIIEGRGFVPGAVHHILRGGRRIGHLHTICLCDPGHHQNGQALGVVSRHPYKARFEAMYGKEDKLLAMTKALVNSLRESDACQP